MFDAKKWFWIVAGSTTQVYSSERSEYVPISDAAYVAFLAGGDGPTRIDTEANLIAVLAAQAPDSVVPSSAGLAHYAASKQDAIMSSGITVDVGSPVQVGTGVLGLALLQGALSLAQSDPAKVFTWVQDSGVPVSLTAAQIQTIFAAVTTYIQSSFTTLGGILQAIGSGAITTKAQVDTPPAPIPAWP